MAIIFASFCSQRELIYWCLQNATVSGTIPNLKHHLPSKITEPASRSLSGLLSIWHHSSNLTKRLRVEYYYVGDELHFAINHHLLLWYISFFKNDFCFLHNKFLLHAAATYEKKCGKWGTSGSPSSYHPTSYFAPPLGCKCISTADCGDWPFEPICDGPTSRKKERPKPKLNYVNRTGCARYVVVSR